MFSRVSNKIATIIFVLLTASFLTFAFLSYRQTTLAMVGMSEKSKEAITLSGGLFIEEYVSSRVEAVENFIYYLQKNPEFFSDKEALKANFGDLIAVAKLDALFIGFEDDGSLINAFFEKGSREPKYEILSFEKDGYDSRSRDWYKVAKADKIFATEPYLDPGSNKIVSSFVKQILINGKVMGVVGADVDLSILGDTLVKMKDSNTGVLSLVDLDSSKLVYHTNKNLIMSDSEPAKRAVSLLQNEFKKYGEKAFEFEYEGVRKVGACKRYDLANWLVCSSNEFSDYDETLNAVLKNQTILSVLFITVIVGILVFAISKFLKPLNLISTGLISFFKFLNHEIKEPAKLNVKTKDEFGQMASLINDNISKIESAKLSEN
ncbi:PDC sensor domain-containing protein, partial [Campylobacter sp. MOP51]|uniref:PDC sensor domain-containing protein n=1 Tax=Campylobacter canis TaxID=3378588 RepID=UPI003C4C36AC